MVYSLLENIHNIPGDEVSRLQKQLGIILRNPSEIESLRTSVHGIFTRMGNPVHYLNRRNGNAGAGNSLYKLMDSFGTIHKSHLETEELEILKQSPYTVWPDENTCMLSEEAMEAFDDMLDSLPSEYLFRYLRRVSTKEKKSWAKWLGLNFVASTERMRNRVLYRKLAKMQHESNESRTDFSEVLLEDIFPDEPQKFPVAWYYRDVLSLYDSLHRMDAENTELNEDQKQLLNQLKIGKILVVREKAQLGCPSKHRLVNSRESYIYKKLSVNLIESDHNEVKERSLFP